MLCIGVYEMLKYYLQADPNICINILKKMFEYVTWCVLLYGISMVLEKMTGSLKELGGALIIKAFIEDNAMSY